MTEEEISQRIAVYDHAYDYYKDKGKMPEGLSPDDPLGRYMQKVIYKNAILSNNDPLWDEILKDAILDFIEFMLELLEPIEEQYKKEKNLIQAFQKGSIEDKRGLWPQVYGYIKKKYKPEEVNIDGYVQQFKETDLKWVFAPLIKDWNEACDARFNQENDASIEKNEDYIDKKLRDHGNRDYKAKKEIQEMYYRYPQMEEIVNIIGRRAPQIEDETDETIRNYMPLLTSPPVPAVEIEDVACGNDLQHLLPVETCILADPQTESLFYYKYAMSQLQLFANKPKIESRMKADACKEKEARLKMGPIIVSMDTSESMIGRPTELARCLLRQLLKMAKEQHRSCFLITFSVRAECLDLSAPGGWRKLDSFLSDCYSGGTDGDEMLSAAIKMLHTQEYAMADMLIISDFMLPMPNDYIFKAMQEENRKGTRFYGFQIGNFPHKYNSILDKVWRIK